MRQLRRSAVERLWDRETAFRPVIAERTVFGPYARSRNDRARTAVLLSHSFSTAAGTKVC